MGSVDFKWIMIILNAMSSLFGRTRTVHSHSFACFYGIIWLMLMIRALR